MSYVDVEPSFVSEGSILSSGEQFLDLGFCQESLKKIGLPPMIKVLSPGVQSGDHRPFLYFSCMLLEERVRNEEFGLRIHPAVMLFECF